MPLLTAAVGAAGTALGLAALGRCAGRTAEEQEAMAAASRGACVKRLGVATCLPAGSWMKASRHVALVGGVLVIGRRPGAAERSLQLRGAHVAVDGHVVKVTARSGAALATFWLNSPVEAARWANELDSCATPLPKMPSLPKTSSLGRRKLQMEAISAEQDLWEARIRMAQAPRAQQDTLLAEVAEKAQEVARLNSGTEGNGALRKRPSLDRRQAEEPEQTPGDRAGRGAALQQGPPDVRRASPGELGLDIGPAARRAQKQEAAPGQGEAAGPPRRMRRAPGRRAAEGAARAAPEAGRGGAAGGAGGGEWAVRCLELHGKLAARGAAAAGRGGGQDARIAELERRLARSARGLLGGPAVVREVVAKPFGAIPEDRGMLGPWSPRGCLCTPRAALEA